MKTYVEPGARPKVHCLSCSLSQLCIPAGLGVGEIDEFERIVRRNRQLKKGEYLFKANQPMEYLYFLRCGIIKNFLLNEDGNGRVTGFVLPGEMLGMDSIGANCHRSFALALDVSLVCSIKLNEIVSLSGRIPRLRYQLLHMLSMGLQSKDDHFTCCLGRAEQRLSLFLLNLAARYQYCGLRADLLGLRMSRKDIANYLQLSTETVSRLFTRFVKAGLISCSGREIALLNKEGLLKVAKAMAVE